MFFIIGLVRSTALYGIFCLLAGLLGFHIGFNPLFQAALHPGSLQDYFLAYMFWSPALLVATELVFFICSKIQGLFGGDSDGYFDDILMRFVIAFSNPWRGLVALIGAGSTIDCFDLYGLYCWFQVILHFLWSVALLGFIGIGFFNLIK